MVSTLIFMMFFLSSLLSLSPSNLSCRRPSSSQRIKRVYFLIFILCSVPVLTLLFFSFLLFSFLLFSFLLFSFLLFSFLLFYFLFFSFLFFSFTFFFLPSSTSFSFLFFPFLSFFSFLFLLLFLSRCGVVNNEGFESRLVVLSGTMPIYFKAVQVVRYI